MAGADILHADLDSFFAAVEQRDDPRLRGRPVIVGGGVVMAASCEARRFGVRSAMGGRQAQRLCPDAIVVPPRFNEYVKASKHVFEIFRDTTPVVEGVSIDEAFLDVSGLRRLAGEPEGIGVRLRERVRSEVGLPISVGVARTKFLAKVASASAKPDGLLLVPPQAEQAFLHPLPIERLWGVGKVTSQRLHARGIHTVGQLAAAAPGEVNGMVGEASGQHLWALANLLDPRPVRTARRRSSIGAQSAIGPAARSQGPHDLDARLLALVDRVTRRMRAADRVGRTLTLRLRFADFERVTRSATLAQASGRTEVWLGVARRLLAAATPMIESRGCTLVGVSISGLLDRGSEQLELPIGEASASKDADVDEAIDRIRQRFGNDALRRAVVLGRNTGFEMPTLE